MVYAASVGDAAVLKLLLDYGADINAQNNHPEAVRILIDGNAKIDDTRRRGGTALSFAADRGNLEIVRMLVENGADINVTDGEMGITPLMDSAYMNQYEVVKYLLEQGAGKTLLDKSGNDALYYAKMRRNWKIIQLLEYE